MTTAAPATPPPARRTGRTPRTWTADEFAVLTQLPPFAGRALSLDGGTIVEDQPDGPQPIRFTRAEYEAIYYRFSHRQRVRLIRGVLVQEPPMNPPHATALHKTTKAIERAFPAGHYARAQQPLDLEPLSKPFPDVAVVVGRFEDYAAAHPTTAVLVVEVSDQTLYEDITTQAELYASAGIADYWVVDIPNRQLRVFRDPGPIPDGGSAYRTDRAFGPNESVAPLAAPGVSIPVADLLP